ncbi:mucin-3A isoform X3 [Nematostella vectensis]|uniref:mucin-3A isoform X3 n=1 Tax=Nematostella vectensis TaxID=45351 RepID=UPI0020772C52|nr:mucin-3A isoform X3 [Nematostella vectensis]
MTTDSCVSCLKKQSFTCNERKCYETSTTFDKRTMEQYCSRRPFIKCTPWKRKLQYNKTSTVSWSPAHSDKSQDYCLLPEMSLPSSVNNRLLVTAVYIIFTSILRTINTHISTQQTTRVLVFVLAISALLSGCGPYVTAESTSLSPGSQPQLELPNAITYVGMAFIYKIPSKIFNCKLDYIEISEGSSRTLPNWLAYDEHKQELYGVPSMEDIGTSYILIVAIADDSLHTGRICGMKSFTINVVAVHHQPHASVIMMASSVALESQVLHFGSGRMNENLFCTPGAQLILGTILLSANLQQVSGHERMMILNKTAQHLKVTTEKMALFSGEVDHPLVSQLKDPSVIKSGAGDGRYSKGKRSLLTWALGCGALKLNSDLLDLETSSKDGTISMLLGHPVIGWHVTSGVQRARHRGRRAILPATPTPTETSMLPTQVKSILTTVLTGSMTLMPTIIQNSTEVLQSSAVASLNVTTIVSATPSFTLSASLSIKPTVILNSTVVVNATINMSSLASSAILVYSTTSPLMNASSEASLTSTEVVNTSSVQPSSSISMTSIMQTDTMNTTFSIQPTPSINVTTVSIEMTSIMPTETMNTTLSLLPDPSINVTNVKSPSLTTSGLLQPSLSANVTTELSKPVNTSFFPQPTPSTNMSSSEVLLSWNSSIMLTPSESANISKMPSSTVSLPGNSSIMETIKVTPTSSLTTPQNTSVVFTNSTVQDTLVLYTSSTPVLNISSGWNSTIVKESTTTLLLSSSSVPLNESTSNVSVAINSTVQASTTIYSLPPTSMLNSTPATVSIDSIAPSPTTPPSSSSTTITTLNASVMATATPSASLETNASTMLSSGISVPSIDSTVLPDSSSFIPTVTTVVQTGSSDMNRTSSITPSFQTASIWTGTPMLTTDIVEPTINASRTSMTTIVSSASGSSVYSAFSINTTDTTLLISKSLRTTETVSMTTSINVSSTILSLLPSIVTSPIMTSVNMSSASIVNSSSIEAIQTSILVVKSSVETSIIGKSTTIANVSSILPSPSTVYMETTSVPDNYTEVTTTHDAASSTTWSVPDIYMTLSITTGVYTSLSSPGIKNTTFTPSEIVSPSISTLHTSTVEVSSTGNVSMLTLKTNSIPVTSPAPSTSLPASSTLPVLPTSSLADTPSTQSVASSGVMVTFSSVAAVNSSTISADITSLISSSSLNISSAYVLSTGVLPGTTSKQSMIQPITSTSFTTTSVLFESSADVSSSSIAFDITSILSTSVLPETTSIQSTMQPNTSTSSPTTSVLFESSADVSSSSIALDITSILSTSVLPETTSIQSTMQPNTSTSSPTTSVLFESSADVSSSSIALDITSILSTSVLPETTSIQSTMQPNTSTVLSSVDSVDSSSVVESSQSRTAATINSTTQESSSFQTSIYPSQSSIFRTSVLPSSYFSSTVIVETSSSSASSLAPSPTATTTSILQTTEPSSTPPTSPALTVTMTTVIATDSSITPTTVTKVIPTSTATVVIPPDLVVVNDIGRVTVTSGKVFNYQVPADTFHDRKDGNTRNLTLELYLVGPQSTQAEIPGWLQFDDKTQTISGLPMDPSETLTRGELFILKARNSRGDIAYDAFEILVLDSQTQHAVELSTRLDNNYTIFSNNLTQRLLLLSAIASFYGDASPGYIRVLRYQEGSVLFIWTNDTLPTSECDPEKNARVSNRVEEDGEVTNAFRQALAPRFPVMSAYSSLVGVCNRTIIPASAIPGARDSEESSDLWVKHVLPGVLVAFILIIIAILLFLYLRRKRPKPADPERRTYKKRKPIILDPEMELKPLPGKPLVLPSDDPSQPPSYISDTSLDKAPYSYYNDDYDDDGDDEEDFKFGSFPPSPIYETPPPVYGGFEPDYRETPPPNYRLPPMYLNYTVPPWETSSDV